MNMSEKYQKVQKINKDLRVLKARETELQTKILLEEQKEKEKEEESD